MIRLPEPKKCRWEGGMKSVPVTFAYPYFKSGFGTYTHRVRTAITHVWKKECKNSHVSLTAWCGCVGYLHPTPKTKSATQWAELPEDAMLCATCEGRAIGAGMDVSRQINGREVIFSPRKP
jgi:hypothetical protein